MTTVKAIATVTPGSSTLAEKFYKVFSIPFNPAQGDTLNLKVVRKHFSFKIEGVSWQEGDPEKTIHGNLSGEEQWTILKLIKADPNWKPLKTPLA